MMKRNALWLSLLLLAGVTLSACAGPGSTVEMARSAQIPAERQFIIAVHDEPVRVWRRAGSISRPYGGTGSYRGSLHARQQMTALARRYDLQPVARWPITMLDFYCVVFEVPQGGSRADLIAQLAGEPGVVIAQPMHEFGVLAEPEREPVAGVPASVAAMGIRAAHEWATGRGVTVALIDTGMDTRHPELEGRVLREVDFVGRKAFPPAEEPHGLSVAGVIASRSNHALGTVGVAPRARLIALRACWHTDSANAVCNSLTLARAISAAVDLAADIINLSLTGPDDPLLEHLLTGAMARGIVAVGAVPEGASQRAGDAETAGFPTSVDGVIPVRSAEWAGVAGTADLHAPGRNIVTLGPGGGHVVANGSSLAAAHVSGAVALLLERRPELSAQEARALLSEFTRPVTGGERAGLRVVNACLAVASLVGGRCPDPVQQAAEVRARAAASPAGIRSRRE